MTKRSNVRRFTPREFDPRNLDQFRTPATNRKGFSDTLSVKVPPEASNLVGAYVESATYPYRNKSELVRHAIVEHLKWLDENCDATNKTKTMLRQFLMSNQLLVQEDILRDFQATFAKMSETVQAHINDGEMGRARVLLHELRGHMDEMPAGYWKTKCRKEFDTRFAHILKGAGVSLKVGDAEEEEEAE